MADPIEPVPQSSAANPTTYPSGKSPILSILSMIGGILGVLAGVVGSGLLFSVAGVVLGHIGQRKEPEAKGFWLTGLITGYVGVLLNLIVLGIWIALWILFATSGEMRDFDDFYRYR
jgi:hypothetical protein